MRPSLIIDPAAQRQLLALPEKECAEALLSLLKLAAAFGNPHVHGGLGIRKLRAQFFECRIGLALRAGFFHRAGVLIVTLIGSHDDVARYLRDRL